MVDRYELIEPTVAEKIYLVLSVALATVCFFGSMAQAAAQLHHKLTRGAQMALHLSHALLGMLTALNVVYPIKSISQPPPARSRAPLAGFLGSPSSCLLFSAGLLLLTLTAGCLHAVLLLVHQLLRAARLGCLPLLQTAGSWLWPTLVVAQWLISAGLAVLPWAGWNHWAGVCHLPAALAPGYMTLLAAVLGGCCALGGALLVLAVWVRRHGRPAADQSPIGGAAAGRHYDSLLARPPAAGLGLAAGHLAAATLAAAAVLAAALAAPPDTALGLLRWAALLLVLVRLLVTVATMFCDDALSSAVLAWLRAVCCCCHGNNAVHPVATTGDDPAHTELDDNFEI